MPTSERVPANVNASLTTETFVTARRLLTSSISGRENGGVSVVLKDRAGLGALKLEFVVVVNSSCDPLVCQCYNT